MLAESLPPLETLDRVHPEFPHQSDVTKDRSRAGSEFLQVAHDFGFEPSSDSNNTAQVDLAQCDEITAALGERLHIVLSRDILFPAPRTRSVMPGGPKGSMNAHTRPMPSLHHVENVVTATQFPPKQPR